MLTSQDFQRELESSPFHPLKYKAIVSLTNRPNQNLAYMTVGVESWVLTVQEIDTAGYLASRIISG